MAQVMNMACAFRDNATSRALFDRRHSVEHSIFAEVNDVACKCRPDFMTADGLMVMDVKTTSDASPEGFGKVGLERAITYRPRFTAASSARRQEPRRISSSDVLESDRPHLMAYYSVPQYLLDYADGLIDCAAGTVC